jgi:hypothetical protein
VNRSACEVELRRTRDALAVTTAKLEQATRQRDIAESRGWRWLNHAIQIDDAVDAMIEHIESEIGRGRGAAAHHRILDRLHELKESFPA